MFVVMGMFSVLGMVNLCWILYIVRFRRAGMELRPRRLAGTETESSLRQLASRVKKDALECFDTL